MRPTLVTGNTYLSLGSDYSLMGVFPVINRINHSCLPNCSAQWNPVTDREELFATTTGHTSL